MLIQSGTCYVASASSKAEYTMPSLEAADRCTVLRDVAIRRVGWQCYSRH